MEIGQVKVGAFLTFVVDPRADRCFVKLHCDSESLCLVAEVPTGDKHTIGEKVEVALIDPYTVSVEK